MKNRFLVSLLGTSVLSLFLLLLSTTTFFSDAPSKSALEEGIANQQTAQTRVQLEKVIDSLSNPWGMDFLSKSEMIFTEKAGDAFLYDLAAKRLTKLNGGPVVTVNGQGGLLGVRLHPDFANNSLVYFSYSSSRADQGFSKGTHAEIARYKLNGTKLESELIVYSSEPNSTSGAHFGGRIEFDADGYLYFSIGDRGERDKYPQNTNLDAGKIYRLHDDGRIPSDNPFTDGLKPAIFSYGHRNPQGLAFNSASGLLWSHEHGPLGGDELNIIRKGGNYGWPILSYGKEYSGGSFAEGVERSGMRSPIIQWTPSIAPCGMTFLKDSVFPEWEGHLLLGSLKFDYIERLEIVGKQVVDQERIAGGIGRVRNVAQGLDGYVYVAIENDGIYKMSPKN